MTDPRDPGWGPSRRLASSFFLTRDLPRLPIIRIRAVYLAFIAFLGVLVVIRLLVAGGDGDMQSGTALTVLVVIAALEVSTSFAWRKRPLIGTEPEDFAAAYRTSVLIRLAYAESIALAGFVLSYLTGDPSTFFWSIALSAPAYALAAPTGADITRYQGQAAGVGVDLMAALLGYTAPG